MTFISPLVIIILIFFAVIAALLFIKFKSTKLWFVMMSWFPWGQKAIKENLKKELEESKKHEYVTFEEFLQDCPKYQIDNTWLGKVIRNLYRVAGAEFQQYVFIDKQSPKDKTAWLRSKGGKVLHEKGTYFKPWDSEKEIIYFDIVDARPLIDMTKTEEMDWKNPDMCADVVTAVTNANGMANMSGEQKNNNVLFILAGIVIIIIALVIIWYTNNATQQQQTNMLVEIANNTRNGIVTIR